MALPEELIAGSKICSKLWSLRIISSKHERISSFSSGIDVIVTFWQFFFLWSPGYWCFFLLFLLDCQL
jgi:hypothetical protein